MNKKILSLGLSLFGFILLVSSIIELLQYLISYIQEDLIFYILDLLISPFVHLTIGCILFFSKNRMLTFFAKQYKDVYQNIIYILLVSIGYYCVILSACNICVSGMTMIVGDHGSGIIDNYIDNYVYSTPEIIDQSVVLFFGVIIIAAAPLITKFMNRIKIT